MAKDAIGALRDILATNWSKPPAPSIEDIADVDKGDAKRVRLLDTDVIRIFETAHNEAQPELVYDFVNEHVNITIDCRTVQSRERLSEMRNEVRRIVQAFRKGDNNNFDRLIYKTRTDLSDRSKKLFRYTIQVEVITFSLVAGADDPVVNPADGSVVGSNVYQTLDGDLTALANLTPSDSAFIVGDGGTWVSESGATARASLGLGTMATQASDNVSITGGSLSGISGLVSSITAGTGITGSATEGAVTLNVGGLTISEFAGSSIQTSAESFTDNDTSLMTSAAIEDKILSYGYTTDTGDITGVTAGTGLSGGGASGTVTLNVSGITVSELAADSLQISSESFANNDTSLMTSAAIEDKILSYGYTTNTGDITSVVAGTGLSGGATSGAATLNLDLKDEDDMASNSATHAASQQSVKAYVDSEVSALVDSAPGALDTLNELAAAINDDASFSTTIATNIGTKLAKASNLSDLANAATARSNLGVDAAGTDNSTDVTLVTTSHDYLSISGQAITLGTIDISDDTNLSVGSGLALSGDTISANLSASDIPNLATSKITSGTFADARIAASNITQHQASLSITESQISDLGSYITAPRTITAGGNTLANSETLAFTAGTNVTISESGGAVTISSSGKTQEEIEDIVASLVVAGSNITKTYDDAAGTLTLASTDTNTQLTTEQVQDIIGAMVSGNTETNIAVTYDDTNGKLDFVSTDTNTQLTLLDQDDMSSNSATAAASQQSIKAYVDAEVAGLVDSAPGTLNTLNELAEALGDDASFSTTITTSIGTKLAKASNLSDLANAGTARTNLGLGAAAVKGVATDGSGGVADGEGDLVTGNAVFDYIAAQNFATSGASNFVIGDITGQTALTSGLASTDEFVINDGGNLKRMDTSVLQSYLQSNLTFTTNTDTQLTTEQVQDIVGAMVDGGTETNIAVTYDDTGGKLNFVSTDTNTQLTQEQVEDYVNGLIVGGTNVTATYDDAAGTLTLASTDTNTQLTQEQVEDFVGGMLDGTETFISVSYDDTDGNIDFVVPVLDEDNMASNSATNLATQQSIKAYIDSKTASIVDSAPAALDTLNELAAALNDDASFSTTTATSLGNRLRIDDNQSLNSTQQAQGLTNLGITASLAEINILDGGLSASDIPSLGTSKITSGTFANARISQGSVTQHQAALSITESQISDLGSYITAPRTVTAGGNTLANGETLAFTAGSNITITESGGAVTITGAAGGIGGSIADTQVAFGNSTNIAGDANFTFDSANEILKVGEIVRVGSGSNTFPAYSFHGNTDIGLRFSQVSSADVLRVVVDGEDQVDFANGAIQPVTNNDIDLGTASLQFKNAYFDGTVEADAITLNGTALGALATLDSVAAGQIDANAVDSSELKDGAVDESHLNATNSPVDNYILSYDSASGGFTWIAAGAGGENNQNAFSTVSVSGQSDVVADGTTDTLTFAAGSNVTLTTNASSDTVTIASTDTNTQLSTEQVQDIVGGMFSGNTETRISATYEDGDGTIDLVVDDMTPRTITAGGNTLASTETLAFTAGSNVTITESGGAVTIASTDTNTQLSLLDEDNFASNSATAAASQQSIKAYVDAEVSGLVDSAPGALNTLNELAAALGDDASFSTTTATSLGNRLRVDVSNQGLNSTQQGNALTNLGITASLAEINILDGGLSASDIPSLATSKITSGTFANGRISEGSVTQHQAALSITESQISDLGSYITAVRSVTAGGNTLASGETLAFTAGSNVTITESGGAVTIASTDTNTEYSAGSGIALSSTTFSVAAGNGLAQEASGLKLDDPANLSELNESTDATDDKILLWDESASSWKYMTLDNLQDSIDTTASGGAGEAFKTISVSGQSDVVADAAADTLTFAEGSNVTITTNASNDTITFASTDTNTFRTVTAGGNTLGSGETLAFTAGSNVSISESGGAVTIASTDTNTQLSQEQVEDFVAGVITAGSNITKTYDDAAGTLTLAATDTNTTTTADVKTALNADLGGNFTIGTQSDNIATFTGGLNIPGVSGANDNTPPYDGYQFRDRQDLGMFEENYSILIKAPEEIYMQLDSNNNNSDNTFFAITKNGKTSHAGSHTQIFKVLETGAVTFNDAFTFPTADGSANQVLRTNGSGTVTWENQTDTNTFRTVTAGGNTLGSSETLAFTAGSNITITESGGAVTIASTDTNTQLTLLDQDDMSSNSATAAASQQSIKAYVDAEVAGIVDSAPAALNTLNELAAALGDDASFSTTITTSIGTKLAKSSNLSDLANAATARSNLGVDAAGTDNSTDVTLVTSSHDYLSISNQAITLGEIDISDDTNLVAGTGISLSGDTLNVGGLTVSEIAAGSIQLSSESFSNDDTSIMTSAAIEDKILSYGYTTGMTFVIEDDDGTEVSISNSEEIKFLSGDTSIDINYSDISPGSDADPFDLDFRTIHAPYLKTDDDRDFAPEDLANTLREISGRFSTKTGLEDGSTTNASDYVDVLVLDTFTGHTGGDANLLAFAKNSTKRIYHYRADQDDTDWGTASTLAYTSDIADLTVSDLAASAVVTESEGIGSNDNDTTLPTSAAVKDYVDNNAGGASALGDLSDVTYSSGDLTISSLDTLVVGGFTIDSSGDLTFDAAGDQIYFKDDGTTRFQFNLDSTPEIDVTGNFTIDGSGDISFDAGSPTWRFKSAGTEYFRIAMISSGDIVLQNTTDDKDLYLRGIDGGVTTDFLRFDASNAGEAIFSGNLTIPGEIRHSNDTNNSIAFGTDTQTFETGGSSRLDISDSGVRLGGANSRVTTILDEDNMASDSDTALATQQSIKAYVDANAGGGGASALNDLSDVTYSSGDLTISSLDTLVVGNFTIDSSGDISLDADGADIRLKDAGTTYANLAHDSGHFKIKAVVNDADMYFMVKDNNSNVNALILDGSEAGAATFNAGVTIGGNLDTNSQNIIIDDNHGILDDSSNEQLLFGKTTSANSYIKIWNGISDTTAGTLFGTDVVHNSNNTTSAGRITGPGLEATGDETDVGLSFKTKGLGHFVFTNDDTTTARGPIMHLIRYIDQGDVSDDDDIGNIRFTGADSSMLDVGSVEAIHDYRDYGNIIMTIRDQTSGNADGEMRFRIMVNDSQREILSVGVNKFAHGDTPAAGVAAKAGQMRTFSSNQTLDYDDYAGLYLVATSAMTFTLPASPNRGEQYVIISNTTGTVTISANGSDTMNGSTSNQTITTRYEAKTFIAVDSSEWIVLG